MPISTLDLILKSHQRNPWQTLYLYSWKEHYGNKAVICDMDKPRRNGVPYDTRFGWSETDWWNNSHIMNVPKDYLLPLGHIDKKTEEVTRRGYKDTLVALLSEGCVIPSRCLDDWLQDNSLKFCSPDLRLYYRGDL